MMYGFEDFLATSLCTGCGGQPSVDWGLALAGSSSARARVGYDNIAEILRGNAPATLLIGLIAAKSVMWAFSLGSGTSGESLLRY